jgi:DNA-binding MurR/RpiR family transcriptional regulator
MASAQHHSFVSRVHGALDVLHPTERRLAEAILNVPGQIASYTATELARMAGVSNATVTRFIRKIGYLSFEDARHAVRSEQSAGAALFRVAGEGVALEEDLRRHLEQSRLNLDQTLTSTSVSTVDAVVERMLAAPQLWIFGHRAGQPFARYLAWQVLQVRSGVHVLPRDGETLAESLAAVEKDDCAIVFALRRPPRLLRALADQLARTGAGVALVGDLTRLEDLPARWHLPCQTSSAGPLFNHVGVMALCGLLASRIVERSGPRSRRRLSRIEDIHDSLDEL